MKVLVTGAGSLCGQGMLRCLQRYRKDWVDIVAVDPSPYAVGFNGADKSYVVPMVVQNKEYVERMNQIIHDELPDVLMCGTDVELLTLRTKVVGTHALISEGPVLTVCDDKWLTYKWLHANGFNPPHTCLLKDAGKEMTFPFIVKPRVGGRSYGVTTIESWGQMDKIIESVDPSADTWIAQKKLYGPEYTAGAIVFPGEEIATIVMERKLKDGNTSLAWVQPYGWMNERIREVAQALQPYGPCNFQFRVRHTGDISIFEINARFSGTTPFRHKAGFPEVSMCLDRIMNGTPIKQPDIKPMVIARYCVETELKGLADEHNETTNRAPAIS